MTSSAANRPPERGGLSILHGSRRTLDLAEHVIRRPAAPLDFDAVTRAQRRQLVRGLVEALYAGPTGVGIAAPMTGVGLRVVVSTAGAEPLAMINPEILESDGPETLELEGNLCLPDVRAKVARRSSVTIRWQTVNSGQTLTRAFDGWEARVLQHELEVLDGVLFIDHADGASAGTWRSSQYQAERGVAAIYGEDDGAPRRGPGPLAIGTAAPGLLELDGTLRRPAAPVDVSAFAPDHLRALVESMLRAQHDARGVGLAAPQVGLALRLVVIDDHEGGPMALINPRILDRDEKTETGIEGCLSIPGWRAEVERSIAVKVETQTVHGEMLELDFRGHRARIAQHELDHLDGVLYTDRVAPDARLFPIDPDTTAEDTLARILKQEAAASHGTSGAAPPRRRRRGKRRR